MKRATAITKIPQQGMITPILGKMNPMAASPTGLADALFTRTQARLLGLLFGQPHRSFFASEIISLARTGSGAVQRELERLEQSGLVTVRRVGRQKHYQANPRSPLFRELRSVVQKRSACPIRSEMLSSRSHHRSTRPSCTDPLLRTETLR